MRKLRIVLIIALLLWLLAGIPCFGENQWLIRINIPEFKLYLYHAKDICQTFDVAVGKQNTPSPLGEFWIANKVIDPTWYPPDGGAPVPAGPKNPLGRYWLGLNVEGYGIHGNSAAWSIGTPASLGCFRLHNKDIKKLFELAPIGTPVQIVYETVKAGISSNNMAWVQVFPDIYKWNNLEIEIAKSIQGLGWIYEPHWRALWELTKAKKPLKVEVPRVIKVEGESMDIDGFYWQQEVYIAQECLDVLSIRTGMINNGAIFNGYIKLDTSFFTGEDPRYFWDREANTLRIIRLKVLLNGMELSNAVCLSKDNQVLVNLQSVATCLGAEFFWDYTSKAFICNGILIAGEVRRGGFWVTSEELTQIWQGLKWHWNRKNATLEIRIDK